MDKQIALSLAGSDIANAVAMARQAGKPEAEVVKFEAMCNAVISKGEALPDAFFASIKSSTTARDIFRAIHAA